MDGMKSPTSGMIGEFADLILCNRMIRQVFFGVT
jgi:hypothetical protein